MKSMIPHFVRPAAIGTIVVLSACTTTNHGYNVGSSILDQCQRLTDDFNNTSYMMKAKIDAYDALKSKRGGSSTMVDLYRETMGEAQEVQNKLWKINGKLMKLGNRLEQSGHQSNTCKPQHIDNLTVDGTPVIPNRGLHW